MATYLELLHAKWLNRLNEGTQVAPYRLINEQEAIRIALLYLCGSESGHAWVETRIVRPEYELRPDYVGDRDTKPDEFGWLFSFRTTNPPGFTFEGASFWLFVHDPSGEVERTLAL